jgi:hypothetical protein
VVTSLVSSKGAAGEYLKFRREDYDDFFIDRSELNARPAPWSPEPGDVSDYESGRLPRAWMDLCPARDRWILAARSLKPPLACAALGVPQGFNVPEDPIPSRAKECRAKIAVFTRLLDEAYQQRMACSRGRNASRPALPWSTTANGAGSSSTQCPVGRLTASDAVSCISGSRTSCFDFATVHIH